MPRGDFFYDPAMHGVDWSEMRERYGALINDCVTRWDVNFVIGELIGELNVSHSYRGGGDLEEATRNQVGLLGVDWARHDGQWQIRRIVAPAPWENETRSPLDLPGVDVSEGDYVLAVNGRPLADAPNPWAGFQGLAGQTVELTVNDVNSFDLDNIDGTGFTAYSSGGYWVPGLSILESASPEHVDNDVIRADLVTSPGGYSVTVYADGTVEYDAGGDDARQSIVVDVLDASTGDMVGEATFYLNNQAPTAIGTSIATSSSDVKLSRTAAVMMPMAAREVCRPSERRDTMVRDTAVAVIARPHISAIC